MAFCNRLGSLLKQGAAQNMQAPRAAIFNSIRCMSTSTTKLFIGGLSWGVDDNSLRDAFSGFGDVVEARVIMNRDTGKSKGFGFVNFSSGDSADAAVAAMDGKELNGRSIKVTFANDRPPPPRGYGGGGGFRGDGDFGNTSF